MSEKRRRRKRQTIVLEELKEDPKSLLSWGVEDGTLVRLETYRLYEAGYAAADISAAFGISREYLYQMWKQFKAEGTSALIDKRWGSEPRKRTTEKEREVLRAKALEPQLGDSELGRRFEMDRSTVYKLLKEHGLQDLHQVLSGREQEELKSKAASQSGEEEGEKNAIEVVESPNALYLALLNPLDQSGFQAALAGLSVAGVNDRYSDDKLRLALVCLQAAGVLRMAHINDQPIRPWGVVIDSSRRPDGDTLDQYLNQLIVVDEEGAGNEASAQRLGRIRPDGVIAQAQQTSLRAWAEAGLLTNEVWRFDGHTVEYSGQAQIGKTKHGTKEKSVPAIDRYTLYNGICALTDYFPTSVSYDEALRGMVHKANQALPEAQRIRKLCFDKEGWNTETLSWLSQEEGIVPIVWVKNTKPNVDSLAQIADHTFVPVCTEMVIGKSHKRLVERIADTRVSLSHLGDSRVVVLETSDKQRVGIYTSAPTPAESCLDDDQCMSAVDVLEAVRLQQHVENGFKVDVHEMGCDAIPTHKTLTVNQVQPYDLEQAEKQLANAHKRLDKYSSRLDEVIPQLQEETALDCHDLKHLAKRSQRLQLKAQQEIKILTKEMESVQVDDDGTATLRLTGQVLDLRKMTLLTLFKAHALVALMILASQLGLKGAGPVRLRREFLAHGQRVEFDHPRGIATVYANPFPRARTQEAYERLCAVLHDVPITLTRNRVSYQVRFNC